MRRLKTVHAGTGACAIAAMLTVIGLPVTAMAQFTAPPAPVSDTTPGRTAESDAKKGDMLGNGGAIMGGSTLDQVQYDIKKRNALFDGAGNAAAVPPQEMVKALGTGVTALAGDDPYWDGHDSAFTLGVFNKIRGAGLSTVRIPVSLFGKTTRIDGSGQIDQVYLQRLDAAVNAALRARLFVIIAEDDGCACAANAGACSDNLSNAWNYLSQHFQDAPASVLFELLDAPHGAVTPAVWNGWLPGLVSVLRNSNPQRTLIVDGANEGQADDLSALTLPADAHTIVSFRYTPDAPVITQVAADFDAVAAWSKANKQAVMLGDYGIANPSGGSTERIVWTRTVSQAAQAHGFARIYTSFYLDAGGNGLFDAQSKKWLDPMKSAVLGK